MGETNRRGSGTLTKAPFNDTSDDDYYDRPSASMPAPPAASFAQQRRPAPQQQSSSRGGGPYFPEDDEDDAAYVASIRPPSNPPPSNTAMAPPPPSLAPPANTARAGVPEVTGGGGERYKDVPTMLHALGLGQYVADFRREELVDMDLLASMWKSERDFKEMLKELGVSKLGHREMIAQAVKDYVQGG